MDTIGYCVRINAHEGYADKIALLPANLDYKSVVAVKHKGKSGENPHYHLVIQTHVASQAFRVRMRKVFDQGKGNEHMSLKPWDGNNDAISYLFHEDENATLIVQHNVSDETIANCRERNRQVSAMVNASRAKASWHLETIVYEMFETTHMGAPPSETTIATEIILAALRNGKYVPQAWHVKAMTERIRFKLLDGQEEKENEFAYRLAKNIFWRPE